MTDTRDEAFYSLALSLCPNVGLLKAKRLVEAVGSASEVYQYRKEIRDFLPDLDERVVESLRDFSNFSRVEKELAFAEEQGISVIPFTDERYPSRLRSCTDAPAYLFLKGKGNFNALKVVGIVGTRQMTGYGREYCEKFVAGLAELYPDMLVVSGLAYGVDITAHRAALRHGMPTVAVLAHGLDRIYPSAHRREAEEMQEAGGIVSEFFSGTMPDRYNFVSRNRIVAGMCDALVVIESKEKGGALITANLANSYHRNCFAMPGRLSDECSVGCIQLIKNHKASLLYSAEEFCNTMGWVGGRLNSRKSIQRDLFPQLSAQEQAIVDLLAERGDLHINTLVVGTNIPVSSMNALLFQLEMKGVIKPLVGGMYHLL